MFLERVYEQLGWPSPQQIFDPEGAGPRVYRELAYDKVGKNIARLDDGRGVRVGVLTADSTSDATQAPIAIVCEFQRNVSLKTLRETHRLAWNFCRSPLLITIEPHLLRAWTCCEPPASPDELNLTAEIERFEVDLPSTPSLSEQAAKTLHWIQLVSGQFFRERTELFRRERCADQMLLSNLVYVRKQLNKLGLDFDTAHDLLGRMIFIQFLFHRKDSSGRPALNEEVLQRLHLNGILSAEHRSLGDVLSNYDDAYRLFRWLNDRFNGDLFPGKGDTPDEREAEWQHEMALVEPKHLELLAQFISGRLGLRKGQYFLWPQYSFDAIPLEFISSIYEEFVGNKPGVHYTPGHLVDFLLDAVLPWDSEEWDIKILDPACGSGIFLVKAFQRLIHRWKNAFPDEEPRADLLKRLLERNIFGVDIDEHAVRVASFSLYLAMCDEIDPRYYWQQVRFPRLRGKRLISADFFREDQQGLRTQNDAHTYDLALGNPIWGRNTTTPYSHTWAQNNGLWRTAYNDIGPLFLTKAAALTKPEGWVAMLQPTGLITNRVSTAKEFRSRFFLWFKVEEIINLSALRFGLFQKAIAPASIVVLRPARPDGEPLSYMCPKPCRTEEDDYRIVIEAIDIHQVSPREAAMDEWVWTALMWGGRRDLALINRLSNKESIKKLKTDGIAITRQGIIRGDRKKRQKKIVGKRMLDLDHFPTGTFLHLRAKDLDLNDDPFVHSRDSTDFSSFELPQMVLKQSWQQQTGRFRAAIIQPDDNTEGIVCSDGYVSIHVPEDFASRLEAACLSYNSKLAVYYLLLTSGRFASYIPEPNIEDLLNVPIPESRPGLLQGIRTMRDLDRRVRETFSLKDSEWILIEDLFNYTLPDFKGDSSSPGRKPTRRLAREHSPEVDEPELTAYCKHFLRVLKAGFGNDKNCCASVFQEAAADLLPVRLVAIHLDWPGREELRIEHIGYPSLMHQLHELNRKFLTTRDKTNGILYQRVARVYDTIQQHGLSVPTLYLIKPDQVRYWTGARALRDADEVGTDIMLWREDYEEVSNSA